MNTLSIINEDLVTSFDFDQLYSQEKDKFEQEMEQKQGSNACKNFVLTKKYIDKDELEEDQGEEIFYDKQYDFTRNWIVQQMIHPYLFMDELEQIDINIKNKIIGWALKQGKQIDFVLADEIQEGRRRVFTINVVIDGEVITSQKGFSKKDASQLAAQKAIEQLGI